MQVYARSMKLFDITQHASHCTDALAHWPGPNSVPWPHRRPSQTGTVLSPSNSQSSSPSGAMGQALDKLSGPSKAEAAAFVSNHSPDPHDLLPGLCLLTEKWLEKVRWAAALAASTCLSSKFSHCTQNVMQMLISSALVLSRSSDTSCFWC